MSIETEPEAPKGESNTTLDEKTDSKVEDGGRDESIDEKFRVNNKYFERKEEKPFFGKEGLPEQDLQQLGSELGELFKNGEFAGVARELAHLKRAGIELKGKSKEDAFLKLKEQAEMFTDKPDELASYLTSLKSIGAIKEPSREQAALIQEAYTKRLANNQVNGLSRLCINAKYLNVKDDFSDAQPYLSAELKRQAKRGNEAGVALLHARAKYVGVPSIVDQGEEQVSKFLGALKIPQRLAELYKKRRWSEFARLGLVEKSLRGQAEIIESVQDKLLEGVHEMSERACEQGSWSEYVRYAGDLASLSRSKKEVTDAQVVAWLSEGSKEKTNASAEQTVNSAEQPVLVEVVDESGSPETEDDIADVSQEASVSAEEGPEDEEVQADEESAAGQSWWGKLMGWVSKLWRREEADEEEDGDEAVEDTSAEGYSIDNYKFKDLPDNEIKDYVSVLYDRDFAVHGGQLLGVLLSAWHLKAGSWEAFNEMVSDDEEVVQMLNKMGTSTGDVYALLHERNKRPSLKF